MYLACRVSEIGLRGIKENILNDISLLLPRGNLQSTLANGIYAVRVALPRLWSHASCGRQLFL